MAKPGGEILFVAGTDTGVGKSLFTAAFTLLDRRGGGVPRGKQTNVRAPRNAAGYKGAASDCIDVDIGGRALRLNEDLLLLALANRWPLGAATWPLENDLSDLADLRSDMDAVAPVRFRLPAAPTVAARAEHTYVNTTRITRGLEELAQQQDRVYYEGIGGLMVPLDDSTLSVDHARRLCDRCRLIARTTLGTINHTALSIAALTQRRMEVEALYLTHAEPRALNNVEAANAAEIARVTKRPAHTLFVVEYLPPTLPRKYAACALPAGLLKPLPADRAQTLTTNWARALQLADFLAD